MSYQIVSSRPHTQTSVLHRIKPPTALRHGSAVLHWVAWPEQGLQVGVCIGNFGFQLKPVPIGSFEPRSWRLLKDCSDIGAATCDAIFLPDKIYPASKIILIRS